MKNTDFLSSYWKSVEQWCNKQYHCLLQTIMEQLNKKIQNE